MSVMLWNPSLEQFNKPELLLHFPTKMQQHFPAEVVWKRNGPSEQVTGDSKSWNFSHNVVKSIEVKQLF